MKKTTAVLLIVAALLVGVAVTVYAQTISYVNVVLKWDNTTQVVGSLTPWAVTWRTIATAKGIDPATCDATCRRAIVGDQAKQLLNEWLAGRIRGEEQAAMEAAVQAKLQAIQGTVE